ncbi:MAG: radical SAM protein [Phycisphaerae bacterium]|nr:radical SAM protein [Phycisphaerae bacterium]
MADMGKDPPRSRPPVTLDHRRQWRDYLYVYPVVSRRSQGLSIGINLNRDKRCTYSCIYCQIDRGSPRPPHDVDLPTLRGELEAVLAEATSGRIWQEARFAAAPAHLRRLNDIAFSGDGEPTCLPNFDSAVAAAAEIKARMHLPSVKIVVITNASQFRSRQFQAALAILDANNGEIWAKLDAGSEAYFQRINRPSPGVTLAGIVEGITEVARGRAVVIQSLFVCLDVQGPPDGEIAAYSQRLREILAGGGKVKCVQVYTIARTPAEPNVSALSDEQLRAIAETVRKSLPGLVVETYSASAFTAPPASEG